MQAAQISANLSRQHASKRDKDADDDEFLDWQLEQEKIMLNLKRESRLYTDFWEIVKFKARLMEPPKIGSISGEPTKEEISIKRKKEKIKQNTNTYITKDLQLVEEKSWYTIHPESENKKVWDVMVGVFVIFSVIIVPFRIGFPQPRTTASLAIDIAIDIVFLLDMVFSVNTAYYDINKDRYEFNKNAIALKYLQFWFWVDFVSIFPLDYILYAMGNGGGSVQAIKIIRLFRLFRLFKLYRLASWGEYLDRANISPSAIQLFILIGEVCFLCHLYACLWHFLALNEAISWLTEFPNTCALDEIGSVIPYIDRGLYDQYVASLYYTTVTLLTIGYGDIYPVNNKERTFAILAMLTGGVVFGAMLSKVALIIDKRNPQAKAFAEMMGEFKAFIDDKELPMRLKTEAKEAYAYYLSKKSSFGEATILEELPKPILRSIIYELYKHEITSIDVFTRYDPNFVVKLVEGMRPFQAKRNEILFDEGDVCNEIIFICIGRISIGNRYHNRLVISGYAGEGYYIGDFEYKKNISSLATYTVVQNCNLLCVTHSTMTRACTEHFEAGKMFQDEISKRYDVFQEVLKAKDSISENDPSNLMKSTRGRRDSGSRKNVLNRLARSANIFVQTKELRARFRKKNKEVKVLAGDNPAATGDEYLPPGENLSGKYPKEVSFETQEKLQLHLTSSPDSREESFIGTTYPFKDGDSILSSLDILTQEDSSKNAPPFSSFDSATTNQSNSSASLIEGSSSATLIEGENGPDPEKTVRFRQRKISLGNGRRGYIHSRKAVWLDGKLVLEQEVQHLLKKMIEDEHQIMMIKVALDDYDDEGVYGEVVMDVNEDFLTARWMIYPANINKIYWDLFIAFLIIVSMLVVPVNIAFNSEALAGPILDLVSTACFGLDLLLSFRTAYPHEELEDTYVISTRKVTGHYLRTWFMIDFISTIPIDSILNAADPDSANSTGGSNKLIRVIRIFRLLKLTRVLKFGKYIEKLEDFLGIPTAVFDLLKLAIQVYVVCHFVACVWFGVCTLISKVSWYDDMGIEDATAGFQYIVTLYWTVATITSVGYGDIVPINANEQLLNIVIILVGASVFGFMIANVTSVMDGFNKAENIKSERLTQIKEYLKEKDCPAHLGEKVLNHFRELFKVLSAFDEEKILRCLPTTVKNKILARMHKRQMNKIAILKYIPNTTVQLYVFEIMKPVFFQKGQTILSEGGPPSEIVFITGGSAVVYRKKRHFTSHLDHNNEHVSTVSSKVIVRMMSWGKKAKDRSFNSAQVHPTVVPRRSAMIVHKTGTNVSPVKEKNHKEKTLLADDDDSKDSDSEESDLDHEHHDESPTTRTPVNEEIDEGAGIKMYRRMSNIYKTTKTGLPEWHFGAKKTNAHELEKESDDFILFNDWHNVREMEKRCLDLVGDLQVGNFVGHKALMYNTTQRSNVTATAITSAYVLGKESIGKVVRIEPTVALSLQQALSSAIYHQHKNLQQRFKERNHVNFILKMKQDCYNSLNIDVAAHQKKSFYKHGVELARKGLFHVIPTQLQPAAIKKKPDKHFNKGANASYVKIETLLDEEKLMYESLNMLDENASEEKEFFANSVKCDSEWNARTLSAPAKAVERRKSFSDMDKLTNNKSFRL